MSNETLLLDPHKQGKVMGGSLALGSVSEIMVPDNRCYNPDQGVVEGHVPSAVMGTERRFGELLDGEIADTDKRLPLFVETGDSYLKYHKPKCVFTTAQRFKDRPLFDEYLEEAEALVATTRSLQKLKLKQERGNHPPAPEMAGKIGPWEDEPVTLITRSRVLDA